MTDRIHSLTVTLVRTCWDEGMRDDDAELIAHMIRQIRGVSSVEKHVADAAYDLALQRARGELREKLADVLKR